MGGTRDVWSQEEALQLKGLSAAAQEIDCFFQFDTSLCFSA